MRNIRGDISVTILVLGTFALCIFAIVSFTVARNHFNNNFANPEVFQNISARMNSFYFYVNSGDMTGEQAAKEIGATVKDGVMNLTAEQRGVLSVEYLVKLNK